MLCTGSTPLLSQGSPGGAEGQSFFYHFGEFTLDPVRHQVQGPDGEVVLRPKTFDLLWVLISNSGRVLAHDALLDLVWHEVYVEPSALTHCVLEIRSALGDDSKHPRFIRTVPKIGYEFIAEVVKSPAPDSDLPSTGTPCPSSETKGEGSESPEPRPVAGERTSSRWNWRPLSGKLVRVLGPLVLAVVSGIALSHYLFPPDASDQVPSMRQLTSGVDVVGSVSWSPDGSMFVFSAKDNGSTRLYVQLVGATEAVPITPDGGEDFDPDWSPSGNLIAFQSTRNQGGIFLVSAVGYSLKQLTAFGYRPRWSPVEEKILFRSGSGLFLVEPGSAAPQEILHDQLADFSSCQVEWQPDGRGVSVLGRHDLQGEGFWTLNFTAPRLVKWAVAENVEQRIREMGIEFTGHFAWSNRGDSLILEGRSHGLFNLWEVEADPKQHGWIDGPRPLTVSPSLDSGLAVSQEGDKVAFSSRRLECRLWELPLDEVTGCIGTEGRPLGPEYMLLNHPAVDSNGRWLSFVANRNLETQELWIRDQLLQTEYRTASGNSVSGRWSADGSRLAFSVTQGGYSRIYQRAMRTGAVLPVTEMFRGFESVGDWSPDGEWIVASSSRDGLHPRILAIPSRNTPGLGAGYEVRAEHKDHGLFQPRFSPDGRWLLFREEGKPYSRIWVIPSTGGDRYPVSSSEHNSFSGCWSPDGTRIYFVSQQPETGRAYIQVADFIGQTGTVVPRPDLLAKGPLPGEMLFLGAEWVEIAVAKGRIIVPLFAERGDFWCLERGSIFR